MRAAFELDALVELVLAPHARGAPVALERGETSIRVPAGATLVVQGLYLAHPDLAARFDALVYLDVDDTVGLRRIAGRDAWTHGPECVLAVKKHSLPAQRAFDARRPPREHARLVLDANNALFCGA